MNNLINISESVKFKLYISGLLASLTSFYLPVQALILPIIWLVGFDILTGMYVVKFIDRGTLTSRGFFKKLPQLLMFFLALTAAIHADPFFVQFGFDAYQSSKFVISFYGLYELFSILENLGKSGLPIAKQISNMLKAKLPEEVKSNIENK